MRTRNSFTLTELLVVIAIIAILAGLLIPAVMLGQQKGRETQAKADMNTIILALKGVENTYQQMVKSPYSFNGKSVSESSWKNTKTDVTCKYIKLGDDEAYDYYMLELSDPTALSDSDDLNINKRKIRFLDPQKGYDPADSIDNNVANKSIWRDPWGNRYMVYINTNFTNLLKDPSADKGIAASAIIYSWGPNGNDDSGKNAAEGTGSDNEDDIVSWK